MLINVRGIAKKKASICLDYIDSDRSHRWSLVSIVFTNHYRALVEYGVANHLPKKAHEHALFCQECEHIVFLSGDDPEDMKSYKFKNSKFMSKYEIEFDEPIPSCEELCMTTVLG